MRRENFGWASSVEISIDDEYLDLHNCYSFVSLHQDVLAREARLKWRRLAAEWVDAELPEGLELLFKNVSHISLKARDPSMPFTEDDCLAGFGYVSDDDWADGPFYGGGCVDPEWRWSFDFQSGAEIIIFSETVVGKLEQ